MEDNKKYYWLKLKEDFFDEKYIKALRKLPDGDALTIVYLKMQLKSLKTEGIIQYDHILPSAEEELALVLDEDVNIVRLTLSAIINMGLVEQWENDTLYMVAMQNLIGSETAVAARVRKHREKQKMLQCNTEVTNSNTYIEIEKKEKKKEKREDIEIREENNIIIPGGNDCVSKSQFEEEFEIIWSEYPNKKGKANALKAYVKARKKGTTKEAVMIGLNNYLTYIKAEKVAQQYIKHGSTWFNQECWNDDYTIRREITTGDLANAGLVDFSKFRN